MQMKQFLFVFSVLALTACSATLPSQPAEFSDYIPVLVDETVEIYQQNLRTQPTGIHTSKAGKTSAENFAETLPDCDWKPFNRVVDGDTIVVGAKEKVRLIGIDTPEVNHPKKGLEKFGIEASEYLSKLLENSTEICLRYDPIGDQVDRYGRTLAYVYAADQMDANAELLRSGMAKGYFYFPFTRKSEFQILHDQAKQARVGLWAK